MQRLIYFGGGGEMYNVSVLYFFLFFFLKHTCAFIKPNIKKKLSSKFNPLQHERPQRESSLPPRPGHSLIFADSHHFFIIRSLHFRSGHHVASLPSALPSPHPAPLHQGEMPAPFGPPVSTPPPSLCLTLRIRR